jgi:hypothetical protein
VKQKLKKVMQKTNKLKENRLKWLKMMQNWSKSLTPTFLYPLVFFLTHPSGRDWLKWSKRWELFNFSSLPIEIDIKWDKRKRREEHIHLIVEVRIIQWKLMKEKL